jgi:hypothetical protein
LAELDIAEIWYLTANHRFQLIHRVVLMAHKKFDVIFVGMLKFHAMNIVSNQYDTLTFRFPSPT